MYHRLPHPLVLYWSGDHSLKTGILRKTRESVPWPHSFVTSMVWGWLVKMPGECQKEIILYVIICFNHSSSLVYPGTRILNVVCQVIPREWGSANASILGLVAQGEGPMVWTASYTEVIFEIKCVIFNNQWSNSCTPMYPNKGWSTAGNL